MSSFFNSIFRDSTLPDLLSEGTFPYSMEERPQMLSGDDMCF